MSSQSHLICKHWWADSLATESPAPKSEPAVQPEHASHSLQLKGLAQHTPGSQQSALSAPQMHPLNAAKLLRGGRHTPPTGLPLRFTSCQPWLQPWSPVHIAQAFSVPQLQRAKGARQDMQHNLQHVWGIAYLVSGPTRCEMNQDSDQNWLAC